MKITVVFDSMEEFNRCMRTDDPPALASDPVPEPQHEPEPAPKQEPKPEPEQKKEEPAYVLADAQKAVRALLRAKGKEVAKGVLAQFQNKDGSGPADGASALKPEDYAAAIQKLQEALNG